MSATRRFTVLNPANRFQVWPCTIATDLKRILRTASNLASVVCSKPASNELPAVFTKDFWKSSVARGSWRLMGDDFASLTVEHPDCQLETTHPVLQYYPFRTPSEFGANGRDWAGGDFYESTGLAEGMFTTSTVDDTSVGTGSVNWSFTLEP